MLPQEVENRLKAAYTDADVAIADLTGAQSNYEIRIASPSFKEMSRVQQHQAVMALFEKEIKTGEVHALSIKTSTK